MATVRVCLRDGADQAGFRRAVRGLVAEGVAPEHVVWAPELGAAGEVGEGPPVRLPRGVAELVELVVCHRGPERYRLLYRLIWRVLHGERALLEVATDPLVHRLERMRKSVRRDLHKMHAFVRFREDRAGRFVAWFEPDHHILEATAGFFVDRFPSLNWSILTPDGSLHWDGAALRMGPPGRREDAPERDPFEDGWRDYYANVFNPARVNPTAMRAEMPKRYWRNMPETQVIKGLIQEAPERTRAMIAKTPVPGRKP